MNILIVIFFFGALKTLTASDDVLSNLITAYSEIEECDFYLNPNNGSYLCEADVNRNHDYLDRCQCDSYCDHLGDCCMDKRQRDGGRRNLSYSCFPYKLYAQVVYYVLTVGSCETTWPNDRVRHLCEDNYDPETEGLDGLTYRIPARSNATGVYYKNVFCAICNRDDADLTNWIFEYDSYYCDGNAIGKLTFHESDGAWTAKNCKFKISNFLSYPYRPCVSKYFVSNCSDSISPYASLCRQYFAPVSIIGPTNSKNNRYFKNYHCYLCNNVSLSPDQFLACGKAPVVDVASPGPYSLSLLVDFNSALRRSLTNGQSGKEDPPVCYSDQVYVKGFKKCMQLQCPWGEEGMTQVSRRHFTLLPNGTVLLVNGKMFSNRTLTYRDGEPMLRVCWNFLRHPNSEKCKTENACLAHFTKFEVGALVLRSNVSLEPRQILDLSFDSNGLVDRVELCAEILEFPDVDCESFTTEV